MGLRYEAWTLPWDTGGFKRKIARLPIIEGTGQGSRPFLTTGGNGSGDISLANFSRLSEVISDTESSLIRVYNGTTVIDEWVAERVSYHHNDAGDKIANVTGGSLVSVFDKYLIYAYDYPNLPTINKDWIWGIPEGGGLIKGGDFERGSLPNGGFEDGNADQWDGTEDDAVFEAGSVSAARSSADARSGEWYMIVNPGTTPATSGARRTINGLQAGSTYTIVGYMDDPAASGDRYRAGVSEVDSASHTNAYEEDDYFWAEVGNVAQGTGASDGTWQQFTLTFVANSDTVELVVVYEGAVVEQVFNLDDWSLTGDGAGLDPWTVVKHGTGTEVNTFRHSTAQAHSGTGSLEMQVTDGPVTSVFSTTLKGYGAVGAEQAVRVELGKLITGSIWIRHDGTGDGGVNEFFRLVLRRATPKGPLQNSPTGWFPAPGSTYLASKTVSIPSNTWTQITVTHETDVTDLTLRIAYVGTLARTDVGTFSSPVFWFDDAVLFEGFVDTTMGDIGTQLFADAAVDHEDDNRGKVLDWIDFSSFNATTDSNSVAWDANIAFKGTYGSTYGNLLDSFVDRDYEYELVPKATPAGGLTHDFHLYNPAGRDSTPATAISPKQSVSGGEVVKRTPDFTAVLVNSPDGAWTEDEDATAITNFGRLESFITDSSSSITSRQHMADNWLTYEAANRAAVRFEVTESDDHPTPLVSYTPGDTIPMQLPPQLQKENRRVQRVDYTNTKPTTYGITGSRVLGGEAAAFDLVWRLWRRFQRVDQSPSVLGFSGEGIGGVPTIFVAASNALDSTKSIAHMTCDGSSDVATLQAANDLIVDAGGGRLLLSEGTFFLDTVALQLGSASHDPVALVGMGRRATVLRGGTAFVYCVESAGNSVSVSDLEVTGVSANATGIHFEDFGCWTNNVAVTGSGGGNGATIFFDGTGGVIGQGSATNILCDGVNNGLQANNSDDMYINGVHFVSCNIGLLLASVDDSIIEGVVVDTPLASHGLRLTSCSNNKVSVVVHNGGAFSSAAVQVNNSDRNVIDLTVTDTNEHAVDLRGASNDNVIRVLAHFPTTGTDNTFDVVNIPASQDVDRNQLLVTGRRGDGTHRWRYGVAIESSGAGANDNRITVDMEDPGTGDILDNGTGTLIAPGAHEWNLGVPSGRTSDLAVVWDGANFVLGAGGGGGGGSGVGAFTNVISLSKEGVLPTAPAVGVMEIPFMWAATIVQVRARVSVAPTGADIILDVNKNGTTMYLTATNPTIAATAKDSGNAVPDATTMAAGDYLSVDIDQIGSTIAGSNLVVVVEWEA